MQINATSPEAIPNVKTILGHEMALELIELKKSFLASVFSQFQPAFDDVGLYQTPDNGWQVNFRHDQNCETRDNAGWNYAAGTMPLVNGRMGSLDGLSRTNSYAEAMIEFPILRLQGYNSKLPQVRQAKLGRTNSGRSYIVKKSTYD